MATTLSEVLRWIEQRLGQAKPARVRLIHHPLREVLRRTAEVWKRPRPAWRASVEVAQRPPARRLSRRPRPAAPQAAASDRRWLEAVTCLVQVATEARAEARQIDDRLVELRLILEQTTEPRARRLLLWEQLEAAGDRRRADWRALKSGMNSAAVERRLRRRRNRLRRVEEVAVWTAGRCVDAGDDLPPERLRFVRRSLLEGVERASHRLIERAYLQALGRWAAVDPEREGWADALERRARDPQGDVWVQCEALRGLAAAAPEAARKLAERRLLRPERRFPEARFVRRFVLDELALWGIGRATQADWIEAVLANEASPHVRQGAYAALGRWAPAAAATALAAAVGGGLREEEAAVRGTVIEELTRRLGAAPGEVLEAWEAWSRWESEGWVQELGIERLGEQLERWVPEGTVDVAQAEGVASRCVARGAEAGWPVALRRRAEDLLERARLAGTPEFAAFAADVAPRLRGLAPGEVVTLSAPAGVSSRGLGRLLAWTARDGEGLYARRQRGGWRIECGARRVFRVWRWWHATWSPSAERRQGVSHVRGSRRVGRLRAHGGLVAEESPTQVPGEAVWIGAEGGWRRFLPLVDDALDALQQGSCWIVSEQGEVRLRPPRGGWRRLRAWWAVSRAYEELSELRERCRFEGGDGSPSVFVERLRGLGFEVEFTGRVESSQCTARRYFGEGV